MVYAEIGMLLPAGSFVPGTPMAEAKQRTTAADDELRLTDADRAIICMSEMLREQSEQRNEVCRAHPN